MEEKLLGIINNELRNNLGLNYEYGEYTKALKYPYGVGEYYERSFSHEDGSTKGEVILTFWNRGSEADLINIKEQIKNTFKDYRKVVDGNAFYITYNNKLFIRTGEAQLKKIEIYLETKYWEKGE